MVHDFLFMVCSDHVYSYMFKVPYVTSPSMIDSLSIFSFQAGRQQSRGLMFYRSLFQPLDV